MNDVDTSFKSWVTGVFDHPVTDPSWHWADHSDCLDSQPIKCVEYLTRLFENPEPVLTSYSDAQLNQAFWYLCSNACSNYMFSLTEPGVSWDARKVGIRSISTLFERLFARRCSEHLSAVDETGANPLNSACYMWWDMFPTWGRPNDPAYADVDAELLAVMKRILHLPNAACQESALHGLGHWHLHYPDFVRSTIDEFLARGQLRRPDIRQYAACARTGYVQ